MNKLVQISFFLILSAYSTESFAQKFDSTAWKYAKTIKAKELKYHLNILASDNFEGRETGKEGQVKARNYIRDEFIRYKISDYKGNNYIQWFSLLEQKNKGVDVKIDGNSFYMNEDFIMSPSVVTNQEVKLEFVFVGYGVEDEKHNSYESIDVKNKAVIFWNETPKEFSFNKDWSIKDKIELAQSKGAKAAFFLDEKFDDNLKKYAHYFEKPKTELYEEDLANQKQFFIFRMSEEMTEKLLKAGGVKTKKLKKQGVREKDIFNESINLTINKPTKRLGGENVMAYIRGTEKADEVVLITAHYDHLGVKDSMIYNGADDNGTGTAALLEMAQAFKQAADDGFRPKRSVVIMAVAGEEKGLLGSRFYVNHPIFPLEKTVANLNVDMIGRYDDAHKKDSNYVYLIGSDKLSDDLHNLSEQVNETYMNIGLDYTYNAEDDPNRFYYRSDHYNFAKNNIPVIFYFSGVHEDYHRPTDTVDKIDFDKTARISKLIFLTAWEIANREERIQLNEN
jgi:hypothetical protein